MPEQDAVLAITGGMDVFEDQKLLDFVWKFLVPAMRPESIPENGTTQETLTRKLSNLSLPPVQGISTSAVSSQISGQTYAVDANELQIETIALDFVGSVCSMKFKTPGGEETISCGYDSWYEGHTTLFSNTPWLPDGSVPVVASGAWTTKDSFTTVVRLYETPFFYTLVFYFLDAEMLVEIQVNVSLDSIKPILLTAHRWESEAR
jgi:hypothetical protein